MSTVKKIFRYLALVLLIIFLVSLIRDIFFGQFSFQENEKLETLIDKKEAGFSSEKGIRCVMREVPGLL